MNVLICEVEIMEENITEENIKELIYKEMNRVAMEYRSSPSQLIGAIILPPVAFELMKKIIQEEQHFNIRRFKDTFSFHGIPLFAGPAKSIMPVYSYRELYCAHQDARRMVSEIGGLDS